MNLKGSITISRVSYNDGSSHMQIRLRDETSRCRFVEVTLSLEDFTRALTAEAEIPCDLEIANLRLLGLNRECRSQVLPRWDYRDKNAERIAAFLAPYEVDEWKAESRDLFNSNRWEGDGVRVGFVRFVAPSVEEG